MENQRDDLVVILAGYRDRMDTFFRSNPGFKSRIAHHVDFPDYTQGELLEIARKMVDRMHYRLDAAALPAMQDYIAHRVAQPQFANARSMRNAIDRARLRQANRLFAMAREQNRPIDAGDLMTLTDADIRASRVLASSGETCAV